MAAPKHRAILAAERTTVVGARATHRHAPERVGEIVAEVNGVCTVRYEHETEAGDRLHTFGTFPLSELTLTP